jgi:hypothetical protein
MVTENFYEKHLTYKRAGEILAGVIIKFAHQMFMLHK